MNKKLETKTELVSYFVDSDGRVGYTGSKINFEAGGELREGVVARIYLDRDTDTVLVRIVGSNANIPAASVTITSLTTYVKRKLGRGVKSGDNTHRGTNFPLHQKGI
jgi:hypothetical protein